MAVVPLVVLSAVLAASCGEDGPRVEVTPPPSGDPVVPVRGTERLAWDQSAPSYQRLQQYNFNIYVDGRGSPLSGVECIDSVSGGTFPCSARLPEMPPGPHTIQLAAVADGVESARSGGLAIAVASGRTVVESVSPIAQESPSSSAANSETSCPATGFCFHIERRFSSHLPISSTATLPDGRILFVEDGRHVRILGASTVFAEPALSLTPGARVVALLVDPGFAGNGIIRIAWTTGDGAGLTRTFGVTRVRELNGRLGEPAAVIPEMTLSAAGEPRVAQDDAGRLYAAMPRPTGNEAARRDAGGDILRFSPEGLTWSAGLGEPAIATGYATPHALAVDSKRARLWLSGRDAAGVERMRSSALEPRAPDDGTGTALSSAIVSLAVVNDTGTGVSKLLAVDADGRLTWAPPDDATRMQELLAGGERVLSVSAGVGGALITSMSNGDNVRTFNLSMLRFTAP